MTLNKGVLALPTELHIEILSHLTLADQLRASQAFGLWSELLLNNEAFKRTRYATLAPGIRGFHQLVSHPGMLMCTVVEGIVQDYLYICDEERPAGENGLVYEGEKQKRYRRAPRFSISKHPILDEPIISPTMSPNVAAGEEQGSERQPHYGLERDYYGYRETLQTPEKLMPTDGKTVREFIKTIANIVHVNSPEWEFREPSRLDQKTELLFWHGWDGEDEDSLEPILDGIIYYTLNDF
ncbi:uncharacterized protein DFL_000642 [Arthrobotrys flagrans]|uniref:F-box domain-containing protein n=1 Tax=Arthrobotrys flagrans TaxID=97331 RepID=A0A437AEI1_ARTFL|nr:hypothetical protein DFL_000642 [Arthrobotrys flagrans]